MAEDIVFPDLFSNGKFSGPGPRRVDWVARLGSTADRGGADKRARRCLAGTQHADARAHRCLPTVVEKDEPDEAVPEWCSPEHERRWRGGATEATNDNGLSSTRGRRKVRGNSGEWGKGVVRARGAHGPL
jgi:hypothetical protein